MQTRNGSSIECVYCIKITICSYEPIRMFLLTSDRDRCHGTLALGSAAFVSIMMELSTDPTLTGRHSMFSKGKTNTVPSDAQAREK